MLETYFVKPQTVDRVRACWIGPEIERYVVWLAEHGYAARCVRARTPLLVAFGEFGWARGARRAEDLPAHVEAFVALRAERFGPRRADAGHIAREVRGPLEQMLRVVLPGFEGGGRSRGAVPFADVLPGFFEYLTSERGLRPGSLRNYQHYLVPFERYLARIGVTVTGPRFSVHRV